jgi:hypothetical protein
MRWRWWAFDSDPEDVLAEGYALTEPMAWRKADTNVLRIYAERHQAARKAEAEVERLRAVQAAVKAAVEAAAAEHAALHPDGADS